MRMFRWRNSKKKRPALRREGWLARRRRLAAAGQPLEKVDSSKPETVPRFGGFTWPDVGTISRVKEVVAAIRAWTYGRLGDLRGEVHRHLAELETAVRHRDAKRADHADARARNDAFLGRVKEGEAEGELHRVASNWARGVFACCVAFATLTMATPVQALGVGIDLGPHHQALAQQVGNALAWLAAFVFGWITCVLGKTVGAAFVNRAAHSLVKDARVASRFYWLVPMTGIIALVGSLYAAAIVRRGQLELVALHSPIPAWAFALFTCAIEVAAIVLGWATAHPVAEAHRRLEGAKDAAEAEAVEAAGGVDRLLGEILAFADEHDAVVLVSEELQAAQFASAAEEIATRAAANPAVYGRFDPLGAASRALDVDPVERLSIDTLLIERASDPGDRSVGINRPEATAPEGHGFELTHMHDSEGQTGRLEVSTNGQYPSGMD